MCKEILTTGTITKLRFSTQTFIRVIHFLVAFTFIIGEHFIFNANRNFLLLLLRVNKNQTFGDWKVNWQDEIRQWHNYRESQIQFAIWVEEVWKSLFLSHYQFDQQWCPGDRKVLLQHCQIIPFHPHQEMDINERNVKGAAAKSCRWGKVGVILGRAEM